MEILVKPTTKDYVILYGWYGLTIIIFVVGSFIIWRDDIKSWIGAKIKKIREKISLIIS